MTRQVLEQERPFAVALDLHSVRLNGEQFYQLCRDNQDLRLELTAEGELIIMAPTGGTTGSRNSKIIARLTVWAEKDGTGVSFDSSTMFDLPNGAKRSPDAAWISSERWDALTEQEREAFVPLCPDFVVELSSPSDTLSFLQEKMSEYIENGAQLGLLIDPKAKHVYVYRPDQAAECLSGPQDISCEPLLPGFVLSMKDIL